MISHIVDLRWWFSFDFRAGIRGVLSLELLCFWILSVSLDRLVSEMENGVLLIFFFLSVFNGCDFYIKLICYLMFAVPLEVSGMNNGSGVEQGCQIF